MILLLDLLTRAQLSLTEDVFACVEQHQLDAKVPIST